MDLEVQGVEDTLKESLEDPALKLAIEETYKGDVRGKRWRPWVQNGKSIHVGDIVLIVDLDTVVPKDCLRDAARRDPPARVGCDAGHALLLRERHRALHA